MLVDVMVVVNFTAFVEVATVGTKFGPDAVIHLETRVLVNAGGAGFFFFADATATRLAMKNWVNHIVNE